MKLFNKLISYTLHPIIFPTIGAFLYFVLSPQHVSVKQKNIILLVIFISTYFLPLILLLLLKRFKIIHSFQLKTIEERKFPIVFLIILSLMIAKMLFRTGIVDLLAISFFGGSLALFTVYLMLLFKMKTSLHTLGIGSLIGFVMMISIEYQINYTLLIAVLFILFGFIATSRLYLKAHKISEVYMGVIIGIVSQVLIYYAS